MLKVEGGGFHSNIEIFCHPPKVEEGVFILRFQPFSKIDERWKIQWQSDYLSISARKWRLWFNMNALLKNKTWKSEGGKGFQNWHQNISCAGLRGGGFILTIQKYCSSSKVGGGFILTNNDPVWFIWNEIVNKSVKLCKEMKPRIQSEPILFYHWWSSHWGYGLHSKWWKLSCSRLRGVSF